VNKIKIKIVLTDDKDELIPTYATEQSAGADLKANVLDEIDILPGESLLVPTGVFLEIPEGFEVQIRPRSGLALKNKITVLNTPGTIDSDYRGEIKVILINHSNEVFRVTPFMRIAQMVVAPIFQAEFIKTNKLVETSRQEMGFGHTGIY
jgi:dUTP pyrophosphatase